MISRAIDTFKKNKNVLKEKIVELQKNLVAIKALGPEAGGDGEYEKAEFIKGYLSQMKGELNEYPIKDERVSCGFRPNFSYTLKGKDSTKRICIVSHLDVVPEGDINLWESKPFELKVENETLIGRGVQDNHSAIVSSILFYESIAEMNEAPAIDISIFFFSDEEVGSGKGIDGVVNEYEPFNKGDIIYVPDMNTPKGNVMEIAEKHILWMKIVITGKQCHGSRPDIGANAHKAGAFYVVKMEELVKKKYGKKNPLYNYPYSSIEPTMLKANVSNVNTIPGEHTITYDSRVLPEYDLDELIEDFKNVGKKIEKDFNVSVQYEVLLKQYACPAIEENTPALMHMKNALNEAFNEEMITEGVGGTTCAYFARKKGYPAVVCGKGPLSAHMPNEYIEINDILDSAYLFLFVLKSLSEN